MTSIIITMVQLFRKLSSCRFVVRTVQPEAEMMMFSNYYKIGIHYSAKYFISRRCDSYIIIMLMLTGKIKTTPCPGTGNLHW